MITTNDLPAPVAAAIEEFEAMGMNSAEQAQCLEREAVRRLAAAARFLELPGHGVGVWPGLEQSRRLTAQAEQYLVAAARTRALSN